MHADPAYQQRRLEGLKRRNAEPGEIERRVAWLQAGRENMSEDAKAARSEHGRRLVRDYLSTPEIRARAHAPEAKAKRIISYIETCMGWCPEELRSLHHDLVRRKRVPAPEARRIIEAMIPGTVEHARCEIANRELAMRLRHERDVADRRGS